MDWLRLKLAEAIGGKQPISKKLVITVGVVVGAFAFLISGVTSNAGQRVAVSAELPKDQVVLAPAQIYVHIVGEVVSPGIYQLESGSRVMDAIFAAGGITKTADQTSVNLAREVTDGEQVIVFKVGAINAAGSTPAGASGGPVQISLNRSTADQLEELPGVGPALAARIVDYRNANGGFKKKEDLLNISGIGDKLFAGIKNEVTL